VRPDHAALRREGAPVLIRQTLAYLPAQILSPLTQFATAIILTHYLPPASYGLTMLIFASQELIYQGLLSWWASYYLRYAGSFSDEARQKALRRTESTVLLASTLLQLLVTTLLVRIVAPDASGLLYAGACFYVVTRSYLGYLSEKARQEGDILAYSLLQIGGPLGGLVLTLALMAILPVAPERVLLDFAIAHFLASAALAWRLNVLVKPGRVDRVIIGAALGFGAPVLISNIFGWFAAHGIRFVVQYGASPTALGLLSVGWGIAIRITAVAAMVVAAAAYPLAVRAMERGDADGARNQISANSALLLGLIAPSTIGVIAISEPFVALLVAPEYQAATIAILPWALVGSAIRNLRMHGWDQMYLLLEAPRAMVILEFFEAALTAIAAFIGLMMGGLVGAVIGATIAALLIAFADYIYLNRRFGLHAPLSFYVRILASTGLMYLALRSLPQLGLPLTQDWRSVGLAVVIGAAVYAILIAMLFPRLILAQFRRRE
jgi:O-antigen/teichoic acid export membrane protein